MNAKSHPQLFAPIWCLILCFILGATTALAQDRAGYTVKDYSDALKNGTVSAEVRPDTVDGDGAERIAEISTPLGITKVRWSRSAEKLFGSGVQPAVLAAWTAAARALAQNSFPTSLRRTDYDWRLVIMDDIPAGVDPSAMLRGGCHPAWMRPPADIYVAAQRVASACGRERLSPDDASKELAQSLIHELGHAIEFQFMGRGFATAQRWHSEGFARWFETLAGQYLPGRSRVQNRSEMRGQAAASELAHWRPAMFTGSAEDYARGYALIAVIAEGKSISRLGEVYAAMDREGLTLSAAVRRVLGWDEPRWIAEAAKYVKR